MNTELRVIISWSIFSLAILLFSLFANPLLAGVVFISAYPFYPSKMFPLLRSSGYFSNWSIKRSLYLVLGGALLLGASSFLSSQSSNSSIGMIYLIIFPIYAMFHDLDLLRKDRRAEQDAAANP